MVSRAIQTEVVHMFRLMYSTIPSLRAPADQRADFYVFKSTAYEALGAIEPGIAAHVQNIADKAMREAHAIALDY
jgi:hypothetical protein